MSDPKSYPAQLSIDYSEKLDKLTTFFRIFVAIPVWIILCLLMGAGWNSVNTGEGAHWSVAGIGIVFLPLMLMILFRKKYPRWWYDWNLNFTKFSTRVGAYLMLLTDKYPSTDEEQLVHIDIPYPDAQKLMRGMPLVKWFLAIPHWFVLTFLYIAAFVVTIIAWFAILFTGKYPKGMFDFIVGVSRWELRVMAYACLLTTDIYPPFSLE